MTLSGGYSLHEYLDYHITDIFFIIILIFLIVYIYTIYNEKSVNEKILLSDISKLEKNIKQINKNLKKIDNKTDIVSEKQSKVAENQNNFINTFSCPDYPTIDEIKQQIFNKNENGISLANGDVIYTPYNIYNSDYDKIHDGSNILNNSVNTINSEYILNQQSLMMDKIKLKLKQYADDSQDDQVQLFVNNKDNSNNDKNHK